MSPHSHLVDRLEDRLAGQVIRPGDGVYEQHRAVWNGSIDRRPGLIARCADPGDVAACVEFAGTHGLLAAVRGGGHSFPGHSVCDGGIVIDLSQMDGIEIDRDALVVRAEAGVLLGELDATTQPYGLAVPAGIVTHTGVAGLTLGGGMGWLQRKYGLTIDQLVSVDVVTAEGELVSASATQNPDLFWGVRGGGGNFGIVTNFEFRLNPLGPIVLAGPIFWPASSAPELLRFYRDWIADAPDELMTIVAFRKAPTADWVPSELHGQPIVGVACCWAGPIEQGERVLLPLRSFASPVIDLCAPKPFLEHQSMFDPSYPPGRWYYVRACDVAELSDEVIDITVEHAERIESSLSAFVVWQRGGAMARVSEEATVFNGRAAGHTFNISGITESADGFEQERDWVRTFWSALEPHHTSVYVNFLMDEGDARIRQAYGEAKYERLRQLKAKYDPDNLFQLNQNIPPP